MRNRYCLNILYVVIFFINTSFAQEDLSVFKNLSTIKFYDKAIRDTIILNYNPFISEVINKQIEDEYYDFRGYITRLIKTKIDISNKDDFVFVDIHHGWASKVAEIYYTSDSGKSWTIQFKSDDEGFIKDIFFLDSNTGWAITSEGVLIKYSSD